MNIYHYVYRITNLVDNKHYYGKRSSKIEPKLDLGIIYFSSSRNKNFIQDQKINPQNYRYKIIKICSSSEEAHKLESKLHEKLSVDINPNFYNLVKSPLSTNFDPKTKIYVKDNKGNFYYLEKDNDLIKQNILIPFNKGKVVVKNNLGETFTVDIDDIRYKSGELKHINCGRKGSKNQKIAVSSKCKNTICVIDLNCNKFRVSKNNKNLNKEFIHVGKKSYLYEELKTGNKFWSEELITTFENYNLIYINECKKSNFIFYTPWGRFNSLKEAYKQCPIEISFPTLKNWCRFSENFITEVSRKLLKTLNNDLAKTYRDLGFYRDTI